MRNPIDVYSMEIGLSSAESESTARFAYRVKGMVVVVMVMVMMCRWIHHGTTLQEPRGGIVI